MLAISHMLTRFCFIASSLPYKFTLRVDLTTTKLEIQYNYGIINKQPLANFVLIDADQGLTPPPSP